MAVVLWLSTVLSLSVSSMKQAHRELTVLCTGIELTLQIQNDVGSKATLKEFKEKLAGDEKHQRAVQALREEVESFASLFPLPGLPDF